MDSINAREQYEEQYEESVSELLNGAEEETSEEAERSGNCCRSSSPRRAPRQHQISESKSVRVEPSVICQLTDDVYAFRDDSSTERLCKVHYGELDEDFLEELSIIHRLKHANLTPIEEVRRTPEVGCVIIYKKNSGNLRDLIEQHGALAEKEASRIFRTIVETVAYCHANKVGLGNNIRLYNIVYDNDDSTNIRFDMMDSPIDMSESALTGLRKYSLFYCAPELILDRDSDFDITRADAWSLGILLFKLLTGCYPFHDTELKKQFTRICHQPLPLPANLSSSALSLLAALLDKRPESRATLELLKTHPWLNSETEINEPESLLF